MWRLITSTFVALTCVASVASAQQPCTTDAQRVVAEVYRHTLERNLDPGAQGWVDQLRNGQITVKSLVKSVATSQEYTERFGQIEAGEPYPYSRAVARLYRHVLGRQPDARGQNDWARTAQERGLNAVVDALVNSAEYNNNFGDWGVPGSGGLRFCGRDAAQPNNQSSSAFDPRFRGMDGNNDGVISRAEWRGNNVAFNNQDWNRDGVLSGEEVRAGGRRGGALRRSDYDFDALDVNNNNRIERREWQARLDQFNEFDTNGDNFLSRAELEGTAGNDTVGTTGDSFVLNATQQWLDTGINVRAGDSISISADGRIRLSDGRNDIATPAGSPTGRRAGESPMPNAPAGVLIARIGNSVPMMVGDYRVIRAPRAGRLFIGVNDDFVNDNQGQYRVTVNVQ